MEDEDLARKEKRRENKDEKIDGAEDTTKVKDEKRS